MATVQTAFIMKQEKQTTTEEHTVITMGITIIRQSGKDVSHMREDK